MGLVRCRDSSSMGRDSSSSPRRRSTSPNRHGLVARDKPILELPNGHPENRWDSLSTKSSLSAIAGAEICPISRGGYYVTLSKFEERKVMLSTPIHFNWSGNRNALKLAQIVKCVPMSNLRIRCSELRGKGFLEYQFTSTVIRNNMWEMWPEKAWNSLKAEGTLFPPNNPPFMSSSEIGMNILTCNY